MSFPEIIMGICPLCRGSGGDSADVTEADAPQRSTTTDPVPLTYYKGDLMCKICVEIEISKEESLASAEKHRQEDKFKKQAGFKSVVED